MPRRSMRFSLRRLLLVLLVLYGVYLVLANVFINSPLASSLVNRTPEKFRMDWAWGLSAWPGQVVLWDLSLEGHVRRTRWSVHTGRAAGYVAMMPLAWRELRVPYVRGGDLAVTIERVDVDMPPPEPRDDAFVLHFPNVRIDTPLQATIMGTRLAGHAEGAGGWRQQLRGGPMLLYPSTLHMTDTTVSRGDDIWMHAVDLTAQARIDEHRRRDFPGAEVIEQLIARLQLQGVANTLAIDYGAPVPSWGFVGGGGTAVADLTLTRGQFENGSRFALSLPLHTRLLDGSERNGDATLQFDVEDGLRLQAHLPPVDVLRSDANIQLRLPTRRLPLPPWDTHVRRVDGRVTLHSRFDSLGWITPLLERLKGLQLEGSGEARADLHIEDGMLAQGSEVMVERADLALVAFDHRVRGTAHASAAVVDDAEHGQRTRARVTFDRFDIAAADAPDAPLGTGRDLVLDLDANGELAQLRDSVSAQLRFRDAELPDLTLFNRYLPSHGARLRSGRGTLTAAMHMDVPGNRSGGEIRFDARRAGLQVGELAFTSDVALDAKLADTALGDLRFGAAGSTLALRNARIDSPKGERTQPWWASLHLQEGEISLRRPVLVRARGEARMRDIGFVLSLFSAKKDFPKWVARLLDAGETTVQGRLHLVEREVIVDHVVASNDRFDVRARPRLGEHRPSADLYARRGMLGLGMELDRGERKMHLVGARKWFDSRPPYFEP